MSAIPSFFSVFDNSLNRFTRSRNFRNLNNAVPIVQRRSNNRYTSSMISRNFRNSGKPLVISLSVSRSFAVSVLCTKRKKLRPTPVWPWPIHAASTLATLFTLRIRWRCFEMSIEEYFGGLIGFGFGVGVVFYFVGFIVQYTTAIMGGK